MSSRVLSLLLAAVISWLALPAQANESAECRRYLDLLGKYEREGVVEYNGISGAVQRLNDEQAQIRIYRLRQLIRQKCQG